MCADMKQFTIQDIRSWRPCYDPNCYLPDDWSGNTLDILKHQDIPSKDKLWVVLREDLIDDKTLRLFAVACARRALSPVANPDPRSLAACDIAERFANGLATVEELEAARRDAYAARADAYAARADACAATAADAVYAAAAAATAAAYDARAAYVDAAREWQVNKLIEILEVPNE